MKIVVFTREERLLRWTVKLESCRELNVSPGNRDLCERRCWTCGFFDHVAAKCPGRSGVADNQQDETNRERSTNAPAHGERFSGARSENSVAEELKNRPVRTKADSVEQASQVTQSSFSDSKYAVTFQIPSRMKIKFEALFRQVGAGQKLEWMTTTESRESEPATVESCAMKSLSEDGIEERMI